MRPSQLSLQRGDNSLPIIGPLLLEDIQANPAPYVPVENRQSGIHHETTKQIKDGSWGLSVMKVKDFSIKEPPAGRWIRFWPWPFGNLRKVDDIDFEENDGVADLKKEAEEEARRLLYVDLTRDRGLLVQALPEKAQEGGLLESLGAEARLFTDWLRDAIRRGHVGAPWEPPPSASGQLSFPRYVWTVNGDILYEGRLVNSGNGEYKGYRLRPEEWPKGAEVFFI